jgi:hypothetical protein
MLLARFQFRDGEVSEVRFSGSYVDEAKTEALRHQAESHPEWSDADMARALAGLGAVFAMDDAESLIRTREVSRFGAVFGPVAVRSASFVWRVKQGRDTTLVNPSWFVSLARSGNAAEDDCIALIYSPVLARLSSLRVASCDSLRF